MSQNIMYSKVGCPFCKKAQGLLTSLHLKYTEYTLDPREFNYTEKKNKLFKYYNHNSFPVIIIGGKLIGGYSDLHKIYVR